MNFMRQQISDSVSYRLNSRGYTGVAQDKKRTAKTTDELVFFSNSVCTRNKGKYFLDFQD